VSLLYNATNTPVPVTLMVAGNQLTITPNSGYTGTFVVYASVSDGTSTATQSFNVVVGRGPANQPPTLAPIANQQMSAGASLTITLNGQDPDGDTLTYSANAVNQLYD